MMDDFCVSLIMPAFNEGEVLEDRIQRVKCVLESRCEDYQIIVVDDGSDDNTWEILSRLEDLENLSSIHLRENRGKGAALREGFTAVEEKYEYVIFCDSDLEIHEKSIHKLLDQETLENFPIVIGSKWVQNSQITYSLKRRLLSHGFCNLTGILFDKSSLKDTQTGLKLFDRDILESLIEKSEFEGFTFETELLILAIDAGIPVKEVPAYIELRNSDVELFEILSMLGSVLRLFYRLRNGLTA